MRAFLDERNAPLDDIIHKLVLSAMQLLRLQRGGHENDETRRLESCAGGLQKIQSMHHPQDINAYRDDRDAVTSFTRAPADREKADITDIMRQLQQLVDEAIDVQSDTVTKPGEPYDISKIDFIRLKQEFERYKNKNTVVQNLRQAVEIRLQRLLQQNPLRTDFQQHYEKIVAEYNREKDRATIEQTFEALLKLVQGLDEEESRAVREGLDEESLAIFDLLKKPDLKGVDIKRIKKVAAELLKRLRRKSSELTNGAIRKRPVMLCE